jgi:hypothetical protein
MPLHKDATMNLVQWSYKDVNVVLSFSESEIIALQSILDHCAEAQSNDQAASLAKSLQKARENVGNRSGYGK